MQDQHDKISGCRQLGREPEKYLGKNDILAAGVETDQTPVGLSTNTRRYLIRFDDALIIYLTGSRRVGITRPKF